MIKTKQSVLAKHVTRIVGELTNENIEKFQIELANIAMKFEMGAFSKGDEYGHTCLIVKQNKYCELINNLTWTSITLENRRHSTQG